MLDILIKRACPFISEGRGTLGPLEFPYDLKIFPKLLPEGEEDSTCLVIGQHDGKPFTVRVWRHENLVFCGYGISSKTDGKGEITLHITTG